MNCGLCCFDYVVIIISPKYSESNITNINDFPEEAYTIKQGNYPCPHLFWEGDKSQCKIHSKIWYKETPCFDFGQIESSPKDICRLGEYVRKKWKEGDIRYNYRFKCETFVEPDTPEEIINAFRQIKKKK